MFNNLEERRANAIYTNDSINFLLEKYQAKDSEYHLVLANCMRDKNMLA